jgi:hypothetical protein
MIETVAPTRCDKAAAWIPLWNTVGYQLVKPYVHGLYGTVAYGYLVPKNHNWANISIDMH